MFRSFDILEQIKPVDRSSNVGAIHRHVGVGKFNPLESGFPSSEAFPIGFLPNPHRRDRADPCDDHTSIVAAHTSLLSIDVLLF